MIKIKQLTIKNFLSIGAVTQAIKLDENGLTLVLGSNTDSTGGITRNGAGKSTILQAVSFSLFGSPLTSIKKDNLINNINGKNMLVTIDFERDGKSYRIERGRKPAIMKFFVNNEEQKLEVDEAQGENRHTQEEIERLLGMSHTMFKHIVALNTFTDPFLKMKAADQRAVIEELLGITQISQRAEVLKKLITQTKDGIKTQEAAIKATAEANDRIQNAIRLTEAKQTSWDSAHKQKIAVLASQLEETINIDFDAEITAIDALDVYLEKERVLRTDLDQAKRELTLLEREADSLKSELTKLQRDHETLSGEAQITRLAADQTRRLKEVTRHEDKWKAIEVEFLQTKKDLVESDSSLCICCGQKLEGTDHLKTVIQNLTEKAAALEADMVKEAKTAADIRKEAETLTEEMDKVRSDIEYQRGEIAKSIDAKTTELNAKADAVITHATMVDAANHAVLELGKKPEASFRSRDEVYRVRQTRDNLSRDLENEISLQNPHDGQIIAFQATIKPIDYEELNALSDLHKHQDFLHKLLTGKDSFIRKRIIDQNLSYLNQRLNSYLDKLGLPHEVRFQSDLSVQISNLGRDFDFEQLSRGEMNRVIMATSWAFRDVWESMNCSCNLLWVDELLDQGTDGQGVEAALSILKAMARDRGKNVFLISHREELQARIDRTLLVRKENGFTTIEADANQFELDLGK